MFHGVGSGKTLSAVVSAYWYLKLYPQNKVIIISPSALLYNFIQGMLQYNIEIQDNRYTFTTYDKYIRNPKLGKNALVIVDEAHNLRTALNIVNTYDADTGDLIGEQSNTNQKGYKIWKYGAMYAHKILLLTGTAFVNSIYDIENLLAMIDQRLPHKPNLFSQVLDSPTNIEDYFSYRISYYESPKSNFFPERKELIIPLYMTDKMEKKYYKIKEEGPPKSESEKPNNFYCAEKYASNKVLDSEGYNPKIKWCIDEIKKKPNQKFIIYSGLYENGILELRKALDKENVEFKQITGNESAIVKEQSKLYFNGYNFRKENFLNISKDNENYKYINSKYRVLLISRAGAEGVDTKNCQNLIILDHQWNDALSEQIIARAIRYKSHFDLPEKERFVNVYRLLLCFKSDEKNIKQIQDGKMDYTNMNKEISSVAKLTIELEKKDEGNYLTTIKELKKLRSPEFGTLFDKHYRRERPFIPEITTYEKVRGAIGKKWTTRMKDGEGWDLYNNLKTDQERKKWRIQRYAEWYLAYGRTEDEQKANKTQDWQLSIDLRLFILCKAKQENINSFIKYFGNNIKLFESYESKLLNLVIKKEKKLKRKLTDEEQAKIYTELLKNEKEELKQIILEDDIKITSKEKKLQQYYTNDKLVEDLIDYSSIHEKSNKKSVDVLEPTSGDGQIVKQIINIVGDIKIDMCELDDNNREKLKDLSKSSPDILNLLNHKNFLTFIPSKQYDYIFMNPPFHIKKSTNSILLGDIFDFDFVKRAYAMLKIGGELIAITYKHWTFTKHMKDWMESKNLTYELRKDEKFSNNVKLDIVLLKIIKENEDEDNKILNIKFYKEQKNNNEGELLLKSKDDFNNLKENKIDNKKLFVEPITQIIKENKNKFELLRKKTKTLENKFDEFARMMGLKKNG